MAVTSAQMTLLGALGAGLAFINAGLPPETAWYIKIGIGAMNAALVFYLGQTNKGTA